MTSRYADTIIGRLDHLIQENFYTYNGSGCDDCHLVEGDHESGCRVGQVVALLDRMEREAKG